MKRNKTLQAVVDKANQWIANSTPDRTAERTLMHSFVSSLLMEANSYHGFNYIYWLETGCEQWHQCGEPEGVEKDFFMYGPSGDKTRVRFY